MSNELAVITSTQMTEYLPDAETMQFLADELKSIDSPAYGKIKIAGAGAGVFKVYAPGDETGSSVSEVEGVILSTTRTNGLWEQAFGANGAADKSPDCYSPDAVVGTRRDTGEMCKCAACKHNQFGSDGAGKRCKNMRNVLILKSGDVLPSLLVLPPTALKAFENYRVKLLSKARSGVSGVVTRITLRNQKNPSGIEYSTPEFEPVCKLTVDAWQKFKTFGELFASSKPQVESFMDASAEDTAAADSLFGSMPPENGGGKYERV